VGLEMCVSADAPMWVDPMPEELAASFIVSRPVATVAGCPSALAAATQKYVHIPGGHLLSGEGARYLARREPLVGAPALGCSLALVAASQEVDAWLVDTRSPAKIVQWTTDMPPLSHVQGPP
jgi:hypothetical protein